jgi:heme-degrading monooxygenase HmoA
VEYAEMAERMELLAREQPGFLGIESVRGADGAGITISYWDSLESIHRWRDHSEHRMAQTMGRERWYSEYHLRICRVEAARQFHRTQ